MANRIEVYIELLRDLRDNFNITTGTLSQNISDYKFPEQSKAVIDVINLHGFSKFRGIFFALKSVNLETSYPETLSRWSRRDNSNKDRIITILAFTIYTINLNKMIEGTSVDGMTDIFENEILNATAKAIVNSSTLSVLDLSR